MSDERCFIICGAQRCGTTSLAQQLSRHPEIEMARPLRPEPKLFLRESGWPKSAEAYLEHFERRPGARLFGEKSTSYMERPEAPGRIRAALPGVRLVFVLRDPIERAISNYRFSVANGAETLSFGEAIRREEERIDRYPRERYSVSPHAYVARGRYAALLDRYRAVFEPSHIKILLLERLSSLPVVWRDLLAFLDVDETKGPGSFAGTLNTSSSLEAKVDEESRRWLSSAFRDSNLELARRYGLDLSCWPSWRCSAAEACGAA